MAYWNNKVPDLLERERLFIPHTPLLQLQLSMGSLVANTTPWG